MSLTSVTYPGVPPATKSYQYQDANFPHALTAIVDENGVNYASWQYDVSGKAISSQHAGGADRTTLSYPSTTATEVTSYVDAGLFATRTYNFEVSWGIKRLTSITGPACPACGSASQTYDANGNVETRTDWNGNRTNYVFDQARNLETSRTEGLTSAGAVTPATRSIETQWHPTFRLPTQVTEKNGAGVVLRATSMSHDAAGNILSRTITAGSISRTWGYTYNANGSVLTMNGPRTDVADVTTYTYYANNDAEPGKRGNLATITNAVGHVTSLTEYNAHGQPLTIIDPNGLVTTLGYDQRQRLVSRTVGGEPTSYDYDGVGQLTKVTLPDGSFLSYTYDAAHRLTQITDALGNRIVYTLDAMGNRTAEEVRDPGNVLAQTRSRVFNNLNRLFQEIGAQNQTTQYGYDNQANVTSVDGPLAGTVDVTSNVYDALNRLIRVTDPNAGQVNYGLNALDQLASVTDPRNLTTTYNYNGLGDLNQQVSPDTGTTTNTFDAAGNLLTRTDAKGQVTSYAYDALNRVSSIAFHDGSRQTYGYDQGANGIGRLTNISEFDPQNVLVGVINYGFDQKGRVVSDNQAVDVASTNRTTSYQYDAFGRLATITYPYTTPTSGGSVTYGYDGQGRIREISATYMSSRVNPPAMVMKTVVQDVQYHPFGGVKGFTFGNGQTYTRGIDQDGRIASYTLGSQSFGIGYDAASRIEFIADPGNPPSSNTYGYDALNRLTSAVLPATNYGYSYDATGNRLTKVTGASTDTYAYPGTSNRLSSIQPASAPLRTYTHDPNGSVTDDGRLQYSYDARGRLAGTAFVGCTIARYRVNALGQRVRKSTWPASPCLSGVPTVPPERDTLYTYDLQGRLIAENHISGGAYKRAYFHLHELPVGMVFGTDD